MRRQAPKSDKFPYHVSARTPNREFFKLPIEVVWKVFEDYNQNWGGAHYKTLIESFHYFMNTYKYIYRNPVRAGVCGQVQDYPFSTLSGLCGKTHLIIPVEEDTLLFDPDFNMKTLEWLNTPSCPQDEEEVRRALRRRIFDLSRNKHTGHASSLEHGLI